MNRESNTAKSGAASSGEKSRNCRVVADIEARIRAFPVMPASCRHLVSSFNNSNADFSELAEEIRFDPGLTANVLKLANSASFGAQREIDSLRAAFVRLGMKQLFQLVVASGSAKVLKSHLKGYDLRPEEFLRHSVWTAVAAEEIATALKLKVPDLLFTAGLLHDLGKIVLDESLEGVLAQDTVNDGERQHFDELEVEVLGINHAQAGAQIMTNWHFPSELVAAVRWHHEPEKTEGFHTLVNAVHIADILAYTGGIGTGVDGMRYHVSESAISQLGMKTSTLELVASKTLVRMNELESILK